jgi:hypothetical protein
MIIMRLAQVTVETKSLWQPSPAAVVRVPPLSGTCGRQHPITSNPRENSICHWSGSTSARMRRPSASVSSARPCTAQWLRSPMFPRTTNSKSLRATALRAKIGRAPFRARERGYAALLPKSGSDRNVRETRPKTGDERRGFATPRRAPCAKGVLSVRRSWLVRAINAAGETARSSAR